MEADTNVRRMLGDIEKQLSKNTLNNNQGLSRYFDTPKTVQNIYFWGITISVCWAVGGITSFFQDFTK